MKKLLSFFIITFALVSCNNQTLPVSVSANPTTASWRCGLTQGKFEDIDLSGEWQAQFNAYSTDALIINDDGFYIQKFTDTASEYHYESESNRWYLEEVPNGGIYIHFEGMLDCEAFGKCIDPINIKDYYDYCSDKWFHFEDEFILTIVGDSNSPKGLRLRRMRPAGCEGCFNNYYFVEK